MQDTLTDLPTLADLFGERSGLPGLGFCARLHLNNDLQRQRFQPRFNGDFYVTCPVIQQALLWPEFSVAMEEGNCFYQIRK